MEITPTLILMIMLYHLSLIIWYRCSTHPEYTLKLWDIMVLVYSYNKNYQKIVTSYLSDLKIGDLRL
jgi:hypothetical protein